MNVVLVGFMGCGKSSVGKILAELLEYRFVDLDHYIVEQTGQTIGELFEQQGEAGFRTIERSALQKLLSTDRSLISTGGGAACYSNNMELMKTTSLVVYLNASPEVLAYRLQKSKTDRPLIRGKSEEELTQFIAEMLEKRAPYYEQAQLKAECNSIEKNKGDFAHEIFVRIQLQLGGIDE